MILPDYRYRIAVVRVIDGDTLVCDIDLGFHASIRTSLRLVGIDCPERGTEAGRAATQFTVEWVRNNPALTAQTIKADKYGGRWDAIIYGSGSSLAESLRSAGHEKP